VKPTPHTRFLIGSGVDALSSDAIALGLIAMRAPDISATKPPAVTVLNGGLANVLTL
jgi:hypothetical protein